MRGAAAESHDHHSPLHTLWHHLVVATIITCGVYWAGTLGLTGGLDSATLYTAQQLVSLRTPEKLEYSEANHEGQPPATVLEISRESYEKVYRGTSPLNRVELERQLRPALDPAAQARLVVIDLDISPATPDDQSGTTLDSLLDSPSNAPVVLVVPSFRASSELAQRQSDWMAQRCAAGTSRRPVYFALPELASEGGAIIRHSEAYPSVGNVARWATTRAHTEPPTTPANCRAAMRPDIVCAVHGKVRDLDLLREYFGELSAHCGLAPIDFQSISGSRTARHRLPDPGAPALSDLAGRVAFVGGSYDSRDVHLTGSGPLDGVYIHAAIFASSSSTLLHLWAVCLEILLGALLGHLFGALFAQYQRQSRVYRESLQVRTIRKAALAWIGSVSIIVVVALFGIVAAYGLVWSSSYSLARGVWVNPVPLVFGMLVDGLVASRIDSGAAVRARGRFPGRLWWVGHASGVLATVFFAATLIDVVVGAFHGH